MRYNGVQGKYQQNLGDTMGFRENFNNNYEMQWVSENISTKLMRYNGFQAKFQQDLGDTIGFWENFNKIYEIQWGSVKI